MVGKGKYWEFEILYPQTILPTIQFSSVAQLCPTLCDPM